MALRRLSSRFIVVPTAGCVRCATVWRSACWQDWREYHTKPVVFVRFRTGRGNGQRRAAEQGFPPRPDQADALRRRRLPAAMAALDHPVERARLRARPRRGLPTIARFWARMSRSASTPIDETNWRVRPDKLIAHDPRRRRPRHARPGRRAVQPVPARARHRAAVPEGRSPGLHGRIPRGRLACHARGDAAGDRRGRRDGHQLLHRRGRGRPPRRGADRRLCRQAEADATTTATRCRTCRIRRSRSCRASRSTAPTALTAASTSAAAARSSARSAPSSTCRGASAASAPPTISSRSCAPTPRSASTASS